MDKRVAVALFLGASVAFGATAAVTTGLIPLDDNNNTNTTIPTEPNNTLPIPAPQQPVPADNDNLPDPDFYNGTCECWYIRK